ncbi:MAG: carboxypeptidase-like regulatory domain-containing protein, partial [Bacteroidia bacterium]
MNFNFTFPKKIFVALCLLFSTVAFAQPTVGGGSTGTIRGFVYLKDSGEPVLFTNVFLKGTNIGNATDVNGYFSITKVPAGTYTLMITSTLGYDSLKETVTVKAGEILSKKLYLTKSDVKLKVIEISAAQEAKQTETQVSVNKIDPISIKRLPSVG